MLFPHIQMSSARFTLALSRLEAALARLDRVAAPANGTIMRDLAALTERHEKLRAGTSEALARIDTLLGTANAGGG